MELKHSIVSKEVIKYDSSLVVVFFFNNYIIFFCLQFFFFLPHSHIFKTAIRAHKTSQTVSQNQAFFGCKKHEDTVKSWRDWNMDSLICLSVKEDVDQQGMINRQ